MVKDNKKHIEHNFDDYNNTCCVCGIRRLYYYLIDCQKTSCLTPDEAVIKDIIE